jgi:hypothetical protein
MKKNTIFLSLIIFLSFTVSTALANDVVYSSKERIIVSVLAKSVDSKVAADLELSEIQFSKLKDLRAEYNKELTTLYKVSLTEEAMVNNFNQLNTRYFTLLNSFLSAEQISTIIFNNTLANVK